MYLCYYVYAYISLGSGQPYYIGKGKNRRAWVKHRQFNHTVETRRQISEKLKNRIVSDETRERMRISALGRVASDETRAVMSAAQQRRHNDASRPKYNHSAETRSKMSDRAQQRVVSDETRAKMSTSRKMYNERRRLEQLIDGSAGPYPLASILASPTLSMVINNA